jgi:hypothetical protein
MTTFTNVVSDKYQFHNGGELVNIDNKLLYVSGSDISEISLSKNFYLKYSPANTQVNISVIKNVNHGINVVGNVTEKKNENMIHVSTSGIHLANAYYIAHASVTFLAHSDCNILVCLMDGGNIAISSICGKKLKKNEICTFYTFGMVDSTISLVNLIVRSDTDSVLGLVDWSIIISHL